MRVNPSIRGEAEAARPHLELLVFRQQASPRNVLAAADRKSVVSDLSRRASKQVGKPLDMTRALKAGLAAVSVAAFLFACAGPAWAQRGGARGGGASHGYSSASRSFSSGSRASVARAPMVRVTPRMAAPVNRTYAARSFVRTRSLNSTRVVTTRPWSDRYGRWHRDQSIVFLGAGYPGYYYNPYDYGFDYGYNNVSYDAQQPDYSQQPEQYVVEQPAPAPVQNAAPGPAAALPDVGEFFLVRKNGQVGLASAFTFSKDRVIYITREGMRRSFPAAELDKDATRQRNEAAGTTVVFPS